MCAAPNGDLYVAVDENGSIGAKEGRGKIIRCRDTDGDGAADRFVTYAELDSPRGLFHDGRKLFVMAPPDLHVYEDTDGDGQADTHDVLVKGLGFDLKFRGADHTTNQLQRGIDGLLYVAVGDYGFVEATDKSGRKLQLRGGGIVRVRPDGTELEIVSRGQRNIYDVAIGPLGQLFTRDNTNDGGGWNVRLTHVLPGAQIGYPMFFQNFKDEHWPAIVDLGGGSPCGSYFMDEPGLPPEIGRTLLTCEWGRSAVFRHPLTPKGATFTAEEQDFLKLPRPTDLDYDGAGNFYVASWRNGGFNYGGPFVGYIVRITKDDLKLPPLPDYHSLSIKELVAQLRTDSLRRRMFAQIELQRRMFPDAIAKPIVVAGLVPDAKKPDAAMPAPRMMMTPGDKVEALGLLTELLFDAKQPLESRVAAIPLINESHRDADEQTAQDFVSRLQNETLAGHDPLVPWISWLLTPLPISQTSNTAILFKALLTEDDPRARLQAAELAARLPFTPLLQRVLLNRLADEDPAVAHRVERAFLQLAARRDAISGTEHPLNRTANNPDFLRGLIATLSIGATLENERLATASARILGQVHTPEVVAEIRSLLKSSTLNSTQREALLTALCRLHFQDAEWDGKWWGTRPDTSGPYYTPETWSETPAIAAELTARFAAADAPSQAFLVRQVLRHKIVLPEILAALPNLAKQDAAFRAELVSVLNAKKRLSNEEIEILRTVALDDKAAPELRGRAIQALCRFPYEGPAFDVGFTTLIALHGEQDWPPEIRRQADQLARDGRNKNSVEQLIKRLAGTQSPAGSRSPARELVLSMLVDAANDKNMKADKRALLTKTFDATWNDPAATIDLLRAIARTKSDVFDDEVALRVGSADPAIKTAALAAAKAIELDKRSADAGPKIATLAYDDVLAKIKSTKGDVARGERLFVKAQCANCHTVTKTDQPKGPFLGGIALRYNRGELSESILKPSAKIAQGFETQWFQTDDGLTHDGFVARESGTEIELRNQQGNVIVLSKEHIEERGKKEDSIMPRGLVDQLTTDDLAALLAYLESLKAQ